MEPPRQAALWPDTVRAAIVARSAPVHLCAVRDTWVVATRAPRAAAARAGPPPAPRRGLAERDIGLLLQQARVAAHLSQADLADLASVPVEAIRAIEKHELRFPQGRLLARMSASLGVDLVREA